MGQFMYPSHAFAAVLLILALSARPSDLHAQSREELKELANQNTVSIISGTPAGTYLSVTYDMSAVLDDGYNLRVLALAGKGSVQNVRDIMRLRGIDMGIVQSDVMTYFKQSGELGQNIDRRLVYVTKLYNEEMHLLAHAGIKSIKDLVGQKVGFGNVNSGTQYSSRLIFGLLGIKVEEVNLDQAAALVAVKARKIAATVFVAGRPASALRKLPNNRDLHLLNVPFTEVIEENSYLPAALTAKDYPNLIQEGERVDTVAVGAVLAAYNWRQGTDRHRRVKKFTDALFSKFDELRKPARHPKWKEVNLAATLKGWRRLPAAQKWVEGLAVARNAKPTSRIDTLTTQHTKRLFKEFMRWRARQSRRQ